MRDGTVLVAAFERVGFQDEAVLRPNVDHVDVHEGGAPSPSDPHHETSPPFTSRRSHDTGGRVGADTGSSGDAAYGPCEARGNKQSHRFDIPRSCVRLQSEETHRERKRSTLGPCPISSRGRGVTATIVLRLLSAAYLLSCVATRSSGQYWVGLAMLGHRGSLGGLTALMLVGDLAIEGVAGTPMCSHTHEHTLTPHPSLSRTTLSLQSLVPSPVEREGRLWRPVATPARCTPSRGCVFESPRAAEPVSGVVWNDFSSLGSGPQLATLLEESVANENGRPFFLARTLIETLFEHFGAHTPNETQPVPRHAFLTEWPGVRPWSLAEPSTVEPLDSLAFGSLQIPFRVTHLHALFQPDFRCIPLSECAVSVEPALREQMQIQVTKGLGQHIGGPTCYADGSYKAGRSGEGVELGWACVFADPRDDSCGVISGTLPQWLAGDVALASAFRAECFALVVGVWLGTAVWRGAGFSLLSDCQAAIEIARGNASVRLGGIASILGHVAHCCRVLSDDRIIFDHIPGHSGIIGNEIADIAAKSAARGTPLGHLVWLKDGHPDWWAQDGVLWSWCSVVCQWAQGDDALPPPTGEALSVCGRCEGLVPEAVLAPLTGTPRIEGVHGVADTWLNLRAASYNALSLSGERRSQPDEGLAMVPARPALLARQLEEHGVGWAAIQEARTPVGFVHTGGFLRFCSGGLKGHLGVELWFRSGYPLASCDDAQKQNFCFEKDAFIVLHRDPRRLLVLFKKGTCQILFAGLHAPHRGHPPGEISEWWNSTEALLHRESRGRLLVVGADCNTSIGSVESRHVAGAEPEVQDHAGDCLHSLLHKCELWAPATWPQIQHGAGWTYVQRRNGALSRPDFVLLPLVWQSGVIQAWTAPGITAANMVVDHLATLVDVRIQVSCGLGPSRKATRRIDARALSHPANRDQLRCILAETPRPSWEFRRMSMLPLSPPICRKGCLRHFRWREDGLCTPFFRIKHGTCSGKSPGCDASVLRFATSCVDRLCLRLFQPGRRTELPPQEILPGCVTCRFRVPCMASDWAALLKP